MDFSRADPGCETRRSPLRGHLAAVADDFLPVQSCKGAEALARPRIVMVGAPGRADTGTVLSILDARPSARPGIDLGGGIGQRLGRLERESRHAIASPLLFWCLVAEEALALGSALALGRVGAMLQPDRVSLLWFAQQNRPAGRIPRASQRQLVLAMSRAAVPEVAVSLFCLGWLGEPNRELRHLARWFG